ncbi:MAG: serine/threonine protein phosphatase, partial [Armatimonadetes bacterium]|nr:serine/threonine protein phosphatase [Armatimonadota bacterium]
GVIERLIALSNRPNFVALRGNHDEWMLRARHSREWFHSWLQKGVGGMATLESYGAHSFGDIPPSHWNFLESTQLFYETDHFLFAHAGLEGDLPLEDQSEQTLMWLRVTETAPHFSGKTFICGHTSQKNGVPLDLGHAICIDTFAHGGGWLSALDCDSRQLFQTNQSGETRSLWLDELEGN